MLKNEQLAPLDTRHESWPDQIFDALIAAKVKHVVYVPDTGHAQLIERAHDDTRLEVTVLTTEEEGIGLLTGAWLGGERGVLLMQSSGVGNCINTLSLIKNCRIPFLTLVTMRGDWAEFNPWQNAMANATAPSLKLMGVMTRYVDQPDDIAEVVSAAADMVFNGDEAMAILISQRMIGRKEWSK